MLTGNEGTPSAGGNESVDAGGAGQELDYGSTTDDQILDAGDGNEGDDESGQSGQGDDENEVINIDAEGDEGGEGEGQDEEEGGEEQEEEGAENQEEDDSIPADQAGDPANFRQVFKAHPELRNSYYREQAYREVMPTVAEARQYKEQLPTIEDVTAAVEARDSLAQIDELFLSSDPASHAQLLAQMNEQDPEAFGRFAQSFPSQLYQLNPDAYRSHIAQPAIRSALGNLMRLAGERGNDNLKNAVDVIAMNLFGQKFDKIAQGSQGQKTQKELDLERREAAINQREQGAVSQKFQEFHSGANDLAVKNLETSITTILTGDKGGKIAGLLKGTALEGNTKAISKIGTDIYTQLNATLTANKSLKQSLRNEFAAAKKDGTFSKDRQLRISNLFMQRAKQLLPTIAKKVVGEYTEIAVGRSRERVSQQRQAGTRVDVTGGAGGGGMKPGKSAGGVNAKSINYSRTTDDDILEGRVTVRKGK